MFNSCSYPYPSRRTVVYAKNAMACTSVPLGAQIGLDVMKASGNAVDAAIAMAAVTPAVRHAPSNSSGAPGPSSGVRFVGRMSPSCVASSMPPSGES